MPINELRGLPALESWCRRVTVGHKDVKISDLSSSWRNGLAFCALIHHFRPELIDFDSLSKENIYHNNKLAFSTAEEHLGIVPLLDAEDMVTYEEPDRCSVATYLSQFYEHFEGSKSHRNSFSSNTNPIQAQTDDTCTNTSIEENRQTPEPKGPIKIDVKCQICKLRVFILERIIIDDKVYHKKCYDNIRKKLDSDKLCEPETDLIHKPDDVTDSVADATVKIDSENHVKSHDSESVVEVQMDENVPMSDDHVIRGENVPMNDDHVIRDENVPMNDDHVIRDENVPMSNDHVIPNDKISEDIEVKFVDVQLEERTDSIDSAVESLEKLDLNDYVKTHEIIPPKIVYPNDMNPFGDDEEEESGLYPKDLNPFGDDENVPQKSSDDYNESLNPFGDDCDNDSLQSVTPVPTPRKSISNVSTPQSVKNIKLTPKKKKKRPAPSPPSMNSLASPPSNASIASIVSSNDDSRRDSIISRESNTSSDMSSLPPSRTPTPQPRLKRHTPKKDIRDITGESVQNNGKNAELEKDDPSISVSQTLPDTLSNNASADVQSCNSLSSTDNEKEFNKNTFGYWKAKKRPAPSIPVIKRTVRSSLSEIEEELNSIGDKLPKLEKRTSELQSLINGFNGEEKNPREEEIVTAYLAVAREKCQLSRRQKELMYMKREHKLEESQLEIEYQMRITMSKQNAQKTKEDIENEETLLKHLMEIVEERNDIVENMGKNDEKEEEEFQMLISKFNIKVPKVDSSKVKNHNDERSNKKGSKKSETEKIKKKNKKEPKEKVHNEDKEKSSGTFTIGKSTLKKLGMKPHKINK